MISLYLEYGIYLMCSCTLDINIKINYGIAKIIFRGKSHEGWYNYSELLSLSQEVDWRELKSVFVKTMWFIDIWFAVE